MKDELITLLETLNFPVFLQGTLNSVEEYPESFFTFWNYETPETAFYDNDANRAVWGFWVYFYSVDPELVQTQPEAARKLLKQNGWILQGKANDISVDKPTHTGAIFTVCKFEEYQEPAPNPEPTPEPEPESEEPAENENSNNHESEV